MIVCDSCLRGLDDCICAAGPASKDAQRAARAPALTSEFLIALGDEPDARAAVRSKGGPARRCNCMLESACCVCGKGPLESSCMTMPPARCGNCGEREVNCRCEKFFPPPHELDARALKARLEDRDVVIGVLRDRCKRLEDAIKAYLNGGELIDLVTALDPLPPEKPRA